MSKKRKKISFIKILIFSVIIIILAIFFNNRSGKSPSVTSNFSNILNISEYKIIKLDENKDYSGIGQEKINNKDGYFTTFTTIDNHKKTYIEYKQNGNSSWSQNEYWNGTMAENGCGITVLSIILSGYNKNYSPEKLRSKYFPVMNYEKLSEELSTEYGIKNSNFYYDSVHLSNNKIIEHLNTNRPIIICVWNKPSDNRWTTSSHYMALLATDNKEKVYVSNPNGGKNDSKSSGWYDINEITPYIAKALYITSYE